MQCKAVTLFTRLQYYPVWCALLIVCCLIFSAKATSAEQVALSKENKIKAAYLLNFTKYIHWPAAQSLVSTPLHLCLASTVVFYDFMADIIARYNASGLNRHIQLEHVINAENCELTYLQHKVNPTLRQLRHSLLVLDSEAVGQPHNAITFYISHRKIRFSINIDVLDALNIRVSSELLKLARIKHNL